MTDVATGSGPTGLLRDLALFVVGHVCSVGPVAATQQAELTVRYRDSPLSVQDGHAARGAARAGDRVPDPVGPRHPDGTPVAVEDLLSRPGVLVLARTDEPLADLRAALGDLGTVVRLTGDTPADGNDQDVLVDPHVALGHALGLDVGRMTLVRPDGYLGLANAPATPEALHRYLADAMRVRDAAQV